MSWYNPFSWGRKKKNWRKTPIAPEMFPPLSFELTPEMIKENNDKVDAVNNYTPPYRTNIGIQSRPFNPGKTLAEEKTLETPKRTHPNYTTTDTDSSKTKKYKEDRDSDVLLGAVVGYSIASAMQDTKPADTYEPERKDYSGGGSTVDIDDSSSSSSSE